MYVFPLIFVMLAAAAISLSKNGIGSFVTLGIFGAALYTVPAVVGLQSALATVSSARRFLVPVPADAEYVILMAWLGLLGGLIVSILLFPRTGPVTRSHRFDPVIRSVALASAWLGIAGLIYVTWTAETFFLLEARTEDVSAVSILWRWTPLLGIIASAMTGQRKLLLVNGMILFIIFLRGDRTLVAIATAALMAAASDTNPGWWKRLKPLQVSAFAFGVIVVFFGKSTYLILKSGLSGRGWQFLDISLKDQFLFQFEPLTTFSHLPYVMNSGVVIQLGDFFASVFGNILLVPSWFGISTNLYNAAVTMTLSPRLGYGVAGNYVAHGYTVAGLMGAVAFYFVLPLILTLCDRQFHKRTGTVKVFWCCVGAVFAFYIHRNGLDNQLSFVRQLFIISVFTALVAAAIRQFKGQGRPARWSSRVRPASEGAGDDEFALHRPGPA